METNSTPSADRHRTGAPGVLLRDAVRVWAKVGLLSFGGPAGQIALMHRMVVDEKRWISEGRFLHALNFCMILPGPEAQQLATYIGWLLHGVRGGLLAGTLFVVPGFMVILGLSFLYVTAGRLPLVQGMFMGFKAAVVAIVFQAVIRIGRRSLKTRMLTILASMAFVAMFVFRVPFPLVIVAAAATGLIASYFKSAVSVTRRSSQDSKATEPAEFFPGDRRLQANVMSCVRTAGGLAILWLVPVVALIAVVGHDNTFASIGIFFSKMATVTFGGAYAVLAYVAQEAVHVHGWLTPGEMIDGLALAETTPGPLILVVQFVGFLAAYRNPGVLPPGIAGVLGSVLTAWVTFVPCFLWIFAGAPYIERLRENRWLTGALSAVTAAVVGVVVNLAVWFSIHTLFAKTVLAPITGVGIELPVLSSIQMSALLVTLVGFVLVFPLRASIVATLLITGCLAMAISWI